MTCYTMTKLQSCSLNRTYTKLPALNACTLELKCIYWTVYTPKFQCTGAATDSGSTGAHSSTPRSATTPASWSIGVWLIADDSLHFGRLFQLCLHRKTSWGASGGALCGALSRAQCSRSVAHVLIFVAIFISTMAVQVQGCTPDITHLKIFPFLSLYIWGIQ